MRRSVDCRLGDGDGDLQPDGKRAENARLLEWGEGKKMALRGGYKINLRKRTVKETLVE